VLLRGQIVVSGWSGWMDERALMVMGDTKVGEHFRDETVMMEIKTFSWETHCTFAAKLKLDSNFKLRSSIEGLLKLL
jgi:hypothetical protein